MTAIAAALPSASPAVAQDRLDGRQLLGGPPPSADGRQSREQREAAAAQLLAAARRELAAGRPDTAQRQLEQLIAGLPDGPQAAEARRMLFAIYLNDRRVAPPPPQALHSGRVREPEPTASPEPQPAPPAAAGGTLSAWRTSTIGYRRLQDDLRYGVGDRVFFSPASAELGTRAKAVVSAQAEWLVQRPAVAIVVEGHADDRQAGGDDERLALQRANVVRDLLVLQGVEGRRINIAAQGARDPVAVCPGSECAAQNRRAVLQVGVSQSQAGENVGGSSGSGTGTSGSRR